MRDSPSDPEPRARILVFTATYDERGNIETFVERVLALRASADLDIDLLIVDDASPDGTGDLLDAMASTSTHLRVVHRPRKMGLGSAHKLAMLEAVRGDYTFLVTLDADLSHDPADIQRLIEAARTADLVTGSRYCAGGACEYTGYRRLVSTMANAVARRLLGLGVHEMTTSLRVYRVSMLSRAALARTRSGGYSFFLESMYRASRAGARLAEIPIRFADRLHGRSKIPRLEVLRGAAKLARLTLHRALRGAPLPELAAEAPCIGCGQPWILPRFERSGTQESDAAAYRCTSLGHRSKPRVVVCLACGLEHVPTSDIDEKLEALYADVVDPDYRAHEAARERTFSRAWNRLARFLPPRGRLLEIGCYTGKFLEIARDRGWDVRGVEPSRWASMVARETRGLDVHCGTMDDLPAGEPPCDAVFLWDVLEHIRDPESLLRQARAKLDDGGVVCLSTIDTGNWFPRLLGRAWPWYMDMHVVYFRRETLEDMLRRAGLEPIHAETYAHFVSLRYGAEKLLAMLPTPVRWALAWGRHLLPRTLHAPVAFGDIKVFVARRVPVTARAEAPATASTRDADRVAPAAAP